MLLIIKDIKYYFRFFIAHGSLFQNFYNRQTAFRIFASGKLLFFGYFHSTLLTLSFFSDVSHRNSSSASHGCGLTTAHIHKVFH